jgi:hypothetical protein
MDAPFRAYPRRTFAVVRRHFPKENCIEDLKRVLVFPMEAVLLQGDHHGG